MSLAPAPASSSTFTAEQRAYWAFQPVRRQTPPDVNDAASARLGIDRFILQRIEREGIEPSPQAERPTLIRRLAFDLLGLPPSADEVAQFVADESPDAYEPSRPLSRFAALRRTLGAALARSRPLRRDGRI